MDVPGVGTWAGRTVEASSHSGDAPRVQGGTSEVNTRQLKLDIRK